MLAFWVSGPARSQADMEEDRSGVSVVAGDDSWDFGCYSTSWHYAGRRGCCYC